MKKWFSLIFVAVIVLGMAVTLIKPKTTFSENENRYLAQMPKFSWEALVSGEFTKGVTEFLQDQFPMRGFFVGMKTRAEKIIGKNESGGIYFADDGYLIEVPTTTDLTVAEKNFGHIKKFADNTDYNVSLLPVPTAYEILKDKLPKNAYKDIQHQFMNKAKEVLADSKAKVIDTFSILDNAKDEYIYYRTDHHQTALGSYLVYRQWCEDNGVTPYEPDDFEIKNLSDSFYGTTWSKAMLNDVEGDAITVYEPLFDISYKLEYVSDNKTSDSLYDLSHLETKNKYAVYMGSDHPIINIETSNKNGKSLAVFKDSYANSILPFLVNHYENIYVVDLRYYNLNPLVYLEENNVDDVLVLYNIANFMSDTNPAKLAVYVK